MWFQLTAARRRLVLSRLKSWKPRVFQLTAARRRLDGSGKTFYVGKKFQLTAARRRLGGVGVIGPANRAGFNSQPPEGGWARADPARRINTCFNSQPPEGGWRLR